MYNPFEQILEQLHKIEEMLSANHNPTQAKAIDVINRGELCKRLNITVPTAIRWEKKSKIPVMRIGSNVRYNWNSVIEALEKKGGSKL